MKIAIKSKLSDRIIISGEYENIKNCLEENRGAYLGGAYLRDANLRGAYLRGAYLRDANLRGADLRDAYLRDAYLRGANLGDADLRDAYLGDANLGGADLRDAYLRGVYLRGANLRDIAHYRNSHDIFIEAVRRQKVGVFTDIEWSAIAQITIHRLCWDSIKKRFANVMPRIFQILAEAGFKEWLEYWNILYSPSNK